MDGRIMRAVPVQNGQNQTKMAILLLIVCRTNILLILQLK